VHISSKKNSYVTVPIRCTVCEKSQEWNIFMELRYETGKGHKTQKKTHVTQ